MTTQLPSYVKLIVAATGSALIGFSIGYLLQSKDNDTNKNNAYKYDDDNASRKLHAKLASLNNQMKNASNIIDNMLNNVKKCIGDVDKQNLQVNETSNIKASMISSSSERFDNVLSKLQQKLNETLSLYSHTSKESMTLKKQLSECQDEMKRMKTLVLQATNRVSTSVQQIPPIGHTTFSWGTKNHFYNIDFEK